MKLLRDIIRRRTTADAIDKRTIAAYLDEEPTVVEAGAHIGRDTVEMARLWPRGRIFAFEPIPALKAQLDRNSRRFSNVTTYQMALGAVSGESQIFVSGGASDASSSTLTPTGHLKAHPRVTFNRTLPIQTITLDGWATEQQVGPIDLLWLDTQGTELQIMMASPRVMKGVKAVYTEVHLVENYAGVSLYREMKAVMERWGFEVKQEQLPWADAGNVLFVRPTNHQSDDYASVCGPCATQ